MSEKNKQFAKEIYDAAVGTDVSPLFITAQACFETGWGKSKIGEYNLWGIKATQAWHGKKALVRTTEILKNRPILQVGESVISTVPLVSGKTKYVCKLWFRDYDSLHAAILDHNNVLKGFPQAWQYRNNPIKFVEMLQTGSKKYATDPNYAMYMKEMYHTLAKLGIK